jgi:hypothetical protein
MKPCKSCRVFDFPAVLPGILVTFAQLFNKYKWQT